MSNNNKVQVPVPVPVKMRRGFMCQSPASMAFGCMPDNVIVPRKTSGKSNHHHQHQHQHQHQHGKINNVKYSRLVVESSDERSLLLKDNNKRRDGFNLNLKAHAHSHAHQPPLPLPLPLPHQHIQRPLLFQVVVLRVSLHCQGCAAKVKKHLSTMEGVTSFTIDLETKRVTVMGHVSPSGLLQSISKIKRAEFWTF